MLLGLFLTISVIMVIYDKLFMYYLFRLLILWITMYIHMIINISPATIRIALPAHIHIFSSLKIALRSRFYFTFISVYVPILSSVDDCCCASIFISACVSTGVSYLVSEVLMGEFLFVRSLCLFVLFIYISLLLEI